MPFSPPRKEVILKALSDGNNPYLCLIDLEKALDSVGYSTFLTHIFRLGVNEKCWHILEFGSDAHSVVKVNQT